MADEVDFATREGLFDEFAQNLCALLDACE